MVHGRVGSGVVATKAKHIVKSGSECREIVSWDRPCGHRRCVSGDTYITVTAHTDQYKLTNRVLQIRAIHVSHTGENIGQILMDTVAEWKLDRSIDSPIPLVSDIASNMDIVAKKLLKPLKTYWYFM